MRVVDVGANVGLYTLLLARLAGASGRVIAFEPEPDLFAVLQRNCWANRASTVTAINSALGEESGRVRFHRSAFNSGDNRLGGFGWTSEAVEVEVARLDEALHDLRVDFLKMDVQGYEMRAFRGMERVLASNPHLELYFEFWPHGLTAAGSDPDELLQYLRERGFRIYEPHGSHLSEVSEGDSLLSRLSGKKFTNLLASRTRVAGALTDPLALRASA
jgi:FkbM family methyltransferase